ncbi:MAG: hypothetical protein KGM44_06565 [bacterium]|nr:hypothetical protein [bacterium]
MSSLAVLRILRTPVAAALLSATLAVAAGDLGRTLWRVHTLSVALRRDEAAARHARAQAADLGALRARRTRLLARLDHGADAHAGAWLAAFERAVAAHRLALIAVHPIEQGAQGHTLTTDFTRSAVEVRLRGGWSGLARWIGDLASAAGTLCVERVALEPAHDLRDGALDARVVIARYEPRSAAGEQ